jgi:broad specificity phosphatase PhoE
MSGSGRPKEVIVVRHGETEWSRAGKHTGRTDIPLTDRGRAQATELRPLFEHRRFGAVFTSPLSRAEETSRLAGVTEAAGVLDDLREWDYGDYEGRTTHDIRAEQPGWTVWSGGLPNGETVEEVGVRADRVIATALAVDGDVAIFGHGHMLRVLTARWCGLPAVDGSLFALDPATVSMLSFERETRVIKRWNNGFGNEADG